MLRSKGLAQLQGNTSGSPPGRGRGNAWLQVKSVWARARKGQLVVCERPLLNKRLAGTWKGASATD